MEALSRWRCTGACAWIFGEREAAAVCVLEGFRRVLRGRARVCASQRSAGGSVLFSVVGVRPTSVLGVVVGEDEVCLAARNGWAQVRPLIVAVRAGESRFEERAGAPALWSHSAEVDCE